MLLPLLGERGIALEKLFHVFCISIMSWENLLAERCSDHRSEDHQLTVDA